MLIAVVCICGAVVAVAVGWVMWVCLRPMTFCLTFDDGFKAHAEIAGPMLRQRGWVGAFNVPTSVIGGGRLTSEQVADLCLVGNEDRRMTWDDVRNLLKAGHEVYPHTCDHADLPTLERAKQTRELDRQVAEAKQTFIEQTGVVPRYFCLPHDSCTPTVEALIRRYGMEPFSHSRQNFGRVWGDGLSLRDVTSFMLSRFGCGERHVDLMIHGIDRAQGGWMPFEDVADFIRFLDEIAAVEKTGKIRAVSYSSAHSPHEQTSSFIRRYQLLADKTRRAYFKLLKRRKVERTRLDDGRA